MAITLDGTNGITTPEIISTAGPVVVNESAPNNSLVVAANGNVGIGSSSPSGKLEVNTGSLSAYFTRTAGDTGVLDPAFGIATASETTRLGSSGDLQFMVGAVGTAAISQNERMRIGSTGVVTIANLAGAGSRTVTAGATGILAAASDSRLKQEVATAPIPGLAEIMRLEPKAYKWLDDIENRDEDASVEIGFFADEVKDIIPSAAPMGNDGYYGFYDRAVIAALTKAVQEQQVLITALTDRIEALETTQ